MAVSVHLRPQRLNTQATRLAESPALHVGVQAHVPVLVCLPVALLYVLLELKSDHDREEPFGRYANVTVSLALPNTSK